uniref:Uncharacterized protein n=1 Tax=Magnetococcus massalia (strain MO-1) TaxID=451514 RepID=A0A1S7LJ57_MAGMO|nr:protein of unknown function [Candidatus Magnetococcus massalia]
MAGQSQLSPFYRGDTKVFNLSFKDGDGSPINIAGHQLWFTMKKDVADPDSKAVLQKQITFPDDAQSQSGAGALTLESTETGSIEPGVYLYDIQKVIPGDPPVVATLMSGKINVLPDITQSHGV